MEENIKEEASGGFIKNLLYVLKRNLILMLVIVILVTACGTVFAVVRNPDYTASYHVSFSAKSKTSNETTSNYNATSAYVDTIVDFCTQGNVVDRANYYYKEWLDAKADGRTFKDFVGDGDDLAKEDGVGLVDVKREEYDDLDFSNGAPFDEVYYNRSSISTQTQAVKEETLRVFYIQYTDNDPVVAKEKVTILFIAYVHEITALDETDSSKGKYFNDITPVIHDLHYAGYQEDMSKFAIVIISIVIGAILAVAVAYIKNMLDNTIKSRQELESLTGTQVLSTISTVKEGEHGKQ